MSKYIIVPTCQIVKGCLYSCIYDLQRNHIYRFSNDLLSLFSIANNSENLLYIKKRDITNQRKRTFVDNLLDKEICIDIKHNYQCFIALDIEHVYSPRLCTHCIIDRDNFSTYSLVECSNLLSTVLCEALCIRYFTPTNIDKILTDLEAFEDSTCRSIEICYTPTTNMGLSDFRQLKERNGRVTKLTLYSQPATTLLNIASDLIVRTSKELLNDETHCGFVSTFYMNAETRFFIESKHVNNCLYKKISIDKKGCIKNCPAMDHIFGVIGNHYNIKSIVSSSEFQQYWYINKDQIEDCCVCEYRYACLDCRKYIKSPHNHFSKPLKCQYNPRMSDL